MVPCDPRAILREKKRRLKGVAVTNPYATQPDTAFWKKAVFEEGGDAAPFSSKTFAIAPGQRVATAGSCFAQHLGAHLRTHGTVGFLEAETLGPSDPVFSARYGNIYTACQLLELFDECVGGKVDEKCALLRKDGKYVDANRPFLVPDGFASADDVLAARVEHIRAAGTTFSEADAFVFTLGLTEAWRLAHSGRVVPACPGLYADLGADAYHFENHSFFDTFRAMSAFVERLRTVNRDAKVILTVSPVPLTATYTSDHVLTATMRSKSVLRAVCAELSDAAENVYYFPSYEYVMNPVRSSAAFEADNLRSVRTAVVREVMGLFDAAFVAAPSAAIMDAEDDVFCDDVEIERSIGF